MPVAVTIASMCHVAVHQSSVRRVIVSQSAKPVSAASAPVTRATTSASHQAFAVASSATPASERIAKTSAPV
jgi:hypothetical protein